MYFHRLVLERDFHWWRWHHFLNLKLARGWVGGDDVLIGRLRQQILVERNVLGVLYRGLSTDLAATLRVLDCI